VCPERVRKGRPEVTYDFGKVPMIDAEEMDRKILAFPNSEEILEWFREHDLDF